MGFLNEYNFAILLDPQSPIEADVHFLLEDDSETIKAHRIFLSLASPVFQRMFSGNFKREDKIKIEQTSSHVFQHMIDFIYRSEEHFSFLPVEDLFELLVLGDRYNVEAMVKRVEGVLINVVKANKNEACLVKIAMVAHKFLNLEPVKKVSVAVLNICSKFVASSFGTSREIAQFIAAKMTENLEQEGRVKLHLITMAASLGEEEWKNCCEGKIKEEVISTPEYNCPYSPHSMIVHFPDDLEELEEMDDQL